MHPKVLEVTTNITQRSNASRQDYLDRTAAAAAAEPGRSSMGCSNLAHGIAACSSTNKSRLQQEDSLNIGIVSAYNDMLSAHQPYETYPQLIRSTAEQAGAVAQVAGGVPAMCDGITQGQDGMDLSLFSRDVIALSTAVALSHNMFDAVICLGICDKIVPGLLMGALSFGHLPTIFVPAGPMPSGLSNNEKAKVREAFASGEVERSELIAAESAAYHSPGTCTFYGTANSNQMLMEFMGLQLPGGSFVNPGTELRDALTEEATRQVLAITKKKPDYTPIAEIVSEKAIVNAIVGLLASGGSTNHTMHLVAIANAAGIKINWTDFAMLSSVVPLLARVYPNGTADVNHFHAVGGLGFMMRELLNAGLLHDDVRTICGAGLNKYTEQPELTNKRLVWKPVAGISGDKSILRANAEPFQTEGGLSLVEGNIGRAVVKVSAVEEKHRSITAPAKVFQTQNDFIQAYEADELNSDMVVVVPFQGPRANGMPELHSLTPFLAVLQNKGHRIALLTDGRMSGASGKVLAAIQVTPEAMAAGKIGLIRDGDMISIDAQLGLLEVGADLDSREVTSGNKSASAVGMGRELFSVFRKEASSAETGASIFFS
ncbi:MAG: phosphogluconate dehydratase [Gammaproteobacteria bacterium]|nr:phosphogluconate dehydratase [Gammaproteobacteria bacterium]